MKKSKHDWIINNLPVQRIHQLFPFMLRIKIQASCNNMQGSLLPYYLTSSSIQSWPTNTLPQLLILQSYKIFTKIPQSYFVSSVLNAFSSFFSFCLVHPVIYLLVLNSFLRVIAVATSSVKLFLTVPGWLKVPSLNED